MTIILTTIMILSTIIFIQLNHPLSITINIIIQTLLTCLMVGHLSTFWFSYILFLIFLGGMLILFLYITSLAPNELFMMSLKFIMFTPIMFLLFLFYLLDPTASSMQIKSNDMITLIYSTIETQSFLSKLFNNPTHYMTIMLMFYLLLTLIVIVKITNIFMGPLRKSN